MSEITHDTLVNEARLHPDNKTDIENRTLLLEQLYLEAGLNKLKNPRVLVLGAGQGADLRAIKALNPNVKFTAAVDAFPPSKDPITDSDGSILARTEREEITGFLDNPDNHDVIMDSNVIVGTRLGPNTIQHALEKLPRDGDFIAIFSTDAEKADVQNALDKGARGLVGRWYASENGMEMVIKAAPATSHEGFQKIASMAPTTAAHR